MAAPYPELVARHGLSQSHRLVIDAVPPGSRVLDAGCSTGYLAERLSARGCAVTGVEADPEAAAAAEDHCDQVIAGDLEEHSVRSRIPGPYEVVIFADVLEHLRDPWGTLAFSRELLAPGGVVLLSLPNVAVWSARRALVRGRFPYAEHGIFDRTHLRFFTRASARELAGRAGLELAEERFAAAALPLEAPLRRLAGYDEPPGWLLRLRERAAALRPELFALQILLTLLAP